MFDNSNTYKKNERSNMFKLASWLLVLSPVLSRFRRPMWKLSRTERDDFVNQLANSPVWLLRQVVEVVKLVAAFAVARR